MKAILFTLLLAAAGLGLYACVSPSEYFARATTPVDGTAPAVTLATKVPTVAGNPGDFSAWIEIAKAVGYIVVGASAKPVASKAAKAVKKAVV